MFQNLLPKRSNSGSMSDLYASAKPHVGEVAGAFVQEMYLGAGSANALYEATQITSGENKLEEDEWKSSPYFREGLEYKHGMSETGAKILADGYDRRALNGKIIDRASNTQAIIGGTLGIAAGIFEPVNFASGVAASLLLGPFGIPVKTGLQAIKVVSSAKNISRVAKVAAVEGALGAALTEPLAHYSAEQIQEDYTLADSFFNLAGSTAFSAGLASFKPGIKRALLGKEGRKAADDLQSAVDDLQDALAEHAIAKTVAGERVEPQAVAEATIIDRRDLIAAERMAVESELQEIKKKMSIEEALDQGRYEHIDALHGELELARAGVKEGSAPEGYSDWEIANAVNTVRGAKPIKPERIDILARIRQLGGMTDYGGELKSIGAHKSMPGVVNNKSGVGIDTMARMLADEGYFSDELDIPDFLDALDQRIRGGKEPARFDSSVEEAQKFLTEIGLDQNDFIVDKDRVADLERQLDSVENEPTGADRTAPYRHKISKLEERLSTMPEVDSVARSYAENVRQQYSENTSTAYDNDDIVFLDSIDNQKFADEFSETQSDIEIVREELAQAGFKDEIPEISDINKQLKNETKLTDAAVSCILGV